MSAPMNTKATQWTIVIDEPKEKATTDQDNDFLMSALDLITSYTRYKFVASIIHDKDTKVNGEPKTPHLHAYIENTTKDTKRAIVNELKELLKVGEECISVEPTNSAILQVQYLTHKNDRLKTQYAFEKIATNNPSLLKEKYETNYKRPLTSDDIEQELFINATMTDLIKSVGLDIAKKYQSVFNQVKNEEKQDIKGLQNQLQRFQINLETIYHLLSPFFDALLKVGDEEMIEALQVKDLRRQIEDIYSKF